MNFKIYFFEMSLKNIKFSVLLPILDRADIIKGFPLSIESIFSNTLIPDQVVVTIDGPVSENFKRTILFYEAKYSLDLVWIREKVGLDIALNRGLEKCKNNFIFRADGDDINLENRFEIQLPLLQDGYDVVGSYVDEYEDNGGYISTRKVPLSNKAVSKQITYRNPINHMTVGFQKDAVLEVGGYPELFLKGDYGLWIKLISSKKRFKNVNLALVKATTGSRMIKDRGGFKYACSEFLLQRFLIKYNLSNILLGTLLFISRSTVFLMPYRIKKIIYRLFLRN